MIKDIARVLVPRRMRGWVNRALGFGIHYSGPYATWGAARNDARGYDEEAILLKVSDTCDRVIRGELAYEQDSVGFTDPTPPERLLFAIAAAAAGQPAPKLAVLDFGGSLGSQYFRARPYLAPNSISRWIVCEQAHYVRLGQQRFQNPPLEFVDDVEAVFAASEVDLVLFSNVLPYLEEPLQVLRRIATLRPRWIFVDRTPMLDGRTDVILVQHTPRSICKSSYPMRLLSYESVRDALPGYEEAHSFAVAEAPVTHGSIVAPYRGVLWSRRGPR